MVLCDRYGDPWHLGCAGLASVPRRYWFCPSCWRAISERNERDIAYDDELLDYLELGQLPDDASAQKRVQYAASFYRYSTGRGLEIRCNGDWLRVPSPMEWRELIEERHVLLHHAGTHAVV